MNFKELLFKAVESAINRYVETGNIGKNEVNLINLYATYYEFPLSFKFDSDVKPFEVGE